MCIQTSKTCKLPTQMDLNMTFYSQNILLAPHVLPFLAQPYHLSMLLRWAQCHAKIL